jgi:hypothetical protein
MALPGMLNAYVNRENDDGKRLGTDRHSAQAASKMVIAENRSAAHFWYMSIESAEDRPLQT